MLDIKMNDKKEIFLSGSFDASQVKKALPVFESIDDSVTVDLKNLDYISSAGLSVFVATHQRLEKLGKAVRLTNMNKHVRNVFQISGLHQVFQIE